MGNHIDRIQEIRDRHAAATPGPWDFAVFEDSRHVIYDNTYFNRHIAEIVKIGVESEQREEDNAAFIAHAPEDIAYLLSQVEFWRKAAETQVENNLAILREHQGMKEALEWYGDKETYETKIIGWGPTVPIDEDTGKRARAAIALLKG